MPSPHALDRPTRDWLDARWAWLAARLGPVGADGPVLLTPEFFPDPFDGSPDAAAELGARVADYMNVPVGDVEFDVFDSPAALPELGAVTDALGYYEDLGAGRCRVWYLAGLLGDPAALVGILAHARLLGAGLISADEPDMEPVTDLATVHLGLGVPCANAAVWERTSPLDAGGWWQAGRRGYLTLPVYGHALARYAHARGETRPDWRRHLRPDVRAAFDEGARGLADRPADAPPPAAWSGAAPFADAPIEADGLADPAADELVDAPEAGCVYCGAALPDGGDGVCVACHESVEANRAALAAEGERPRGAAFDRWVLRLAGLLVAAAVLWAVLS